MQYAWASEAMEQGERGPPGFSYM